MLDRIKDMINRGGENVYCVEVENALIGAPGVGEVAVVGVPDAMMGEKVGAVIVPLPGATVDPEAVEQASVTATVQPSSIDTGNANRDNDLKSDDFFDATKFPEITFKSKSVKQTGKDTADILGDFTMHGVTKDVTLHAQFLGKGKGMKSEISGWHLTTDPIKRSDYGLNWNKTIEGTQVVGDDVEITIDVEADKV